MRLTESQLKRIIRQTIREGRPFYRNPFGRFRSLENFLMTVIYPCFEMGYNADYCYSHSLGAEEMQIMRANINEIHGLFGDPEFENYATAIAELCLGE